MRRWRTPLLIVVALLATLIWLAVPPALLPGRESHGPPIGDSKLIRILQQTYFLSFTCGVVSGAAIAFAFALRSKRAPEIGR